MRLTPGLQSRPNRSKPVSVERTVNFYAEQSPEDQQRGPVTLQATPGMTLLVDTAAGGSVRGVHNMGGAVYVIANQTGYVIPSAGLAIALGPVTGTGPVFMADNGQQVMVVTDETKGFIMTPTSVTEITDPDFPTAGTVCFIDGFFVVNQPSSKRFFLSALNDGLTWDALDFASAEADPDNLLAVVSDHRELWLFGEKTIEIWTNTGAAPFPFERISGAYLTKGTVSPKSIASIDNTLMWLGNDFVVYRADGYAPVRVSTHEMENLIARLADKATARAFSYTQEGHSFYCLTLPGITTMVYDASTGIWHERVSDGRDDWLAFDGTDAYGGAVVGSAADGKVAFLDQAAFTEMGGIMRRSIITPGIWADGQRGTMSRLMWDFETGVGLTAGQGSDPTVMLSYSNDSGRTWSSERRASIGKIGEYRKRAQWWRLGQFRDRRFKITLSDAVQARSIGLYGDVEPGRI